MFLQLSIINLKQLSTVFFVVVVVVVVVVVEKGT